MASLIITPLKIAPESEVTKKYVEIQNRMLFLYSSSYLNYNSLSEL